jgi:glycosyltransferase involved in cell wall biosynthesis
MNTEFFTICARNYLAFAVTLGESLRRQHPAAHFTIWLLDQGELPPVPPEIVIRLVEDDAVPGGEFMDLCLRYNITELATAVKPACMMRHFRDGAERVLYMDPDIYVFRPLQAVMDALEAGAQGVLIPHILQPLPRDDAHPDDLDILRSGTYNLGFLALTAGSETDALLNWWWSWLRTHAFSHRGGVFTDQKWMNFAVVFWPRLHVLRHPGYNVAYWNLPQRRLTRVGDDWQVDGEPLVFFHFSGFNPANPQLLSKHQNRILIKPWSDLAKLLDFYVGEIMSRGHSQLQQLPLPRLSFANGVFFDWVCQRLYQEAKDQGRRFAHPLAIGPGTFFAWVNEPLLNGSPAGAPRITRYLKTLYELRQDVQNAYPDLFGKDRSGFLTWVQCNAVREMSINSYFLTQAGVTDKAAEQQLPGVNFAGYLRSELGIGEAARGYVRALRGQGVPLSYVDVSSFSVNRKQDQSLGELPIPQDNPAPYAINIVHVNADQLLLVRDHVGPDFFQNRYTIGIWAWESLSFPQDWYDRFTLVDEIWVGSGFMVDAIGRVASIPVIQMPHVVEVPDCLPDRAAFGLADDEFVFLFMFDFHSTLQRKNPEAAIAAFRHAFEPHQPVRLLIKSMQGDQHPTTFQALRQRAGDARISFLDCTLDNEERYRLIASCDAFLSLHRAEGFGLAIAEAMAMGKPVIATGWSGNMDFMNVANSLPAAYTLKPLEQGEGPYEQGTLWAEPDIEHAAQLMRQIVSDASLAQRLGARAKLDIQTYFSTAAVGERLVERLRLISQRRELAVQSSLAQDNRMTPLPQQGRLWLLGSRVWRSFLRLLPAQAQLAASRTLGKLMKRLHLLS